MEIIKNSEEEEHEESSNLLSTIPGKYDILFEIFSFLPLKSILKFKSVSKTIQDLTLHPKFIPKHFANFKPTLTGLFYQIKIEYCEFDERFFLKNVEFLPTKSEVDLQNPNLPKPNLDFLKQKNKNEKHNVKQKEVLEIRVIDSCNGLLLCSAVTGTTNPVTTIYVYNPLTKEKLQLPHPKKRSSRLDYAILTDLIGFRVACLHRPTKRIYETELIIYSSETGEWEEIEEKLPELSHEIIIGSKAFFNGSLFWDCFDNHILVLHMNAAKPYELIEAPRAALGRCLFKFDQKLVCYCYTSDNDFPAWCFTNLTSTAITKKNKLPHWKVEDGEIFESLSEDVSSSLYNYKGTSRKPFKIIAYDHKSCTMYLSVNNLIYSYQVENRILDMLVGGNAKFWGSRTKLAYVLPYIHTLAKIKTKNVAEDVKKKEEKAKEEETKSCVYLVEEDLVNDIAPRRKGNKAKRREKKSLESIQTQSVTDDENEIERETNEYETNIPGSLVEDEIIALSIGKKGSKAKRRGKKRSEVLAHYRAFRESRTQHSVMLQAKPRISILQFLNQAISVSRTVGKKEQLSRQEFEEFLTVLEEIIAPYLRCGGIRRLSFQDKIAQSSSSQQQKKITSTGTSVRQEHTEDDKVNEKEMDEEEKKARGYVVEDEMGDDFASSSNEKNGRRAKRRGRKR